MKIILISIGTRGDFVWNEIIYDIGAGPKGIKIGKITTKNLEPKILELVNNRSFKKKAGALVAPALVRFIFLVHLLAFSMAGNFC